MHAAGSVPAPSSSPFNPIGKIGYVPLLFFLFLLHSRVLDLTYDHLKIPFVTLTVCLVAAVLGGGLLRVFTHRISVAFMLLTGWMIMAVPFSVWRGGSAETVKEWCKAFAVFVVVVALIGTFRQLRGAMHILAFSLLLLAVLALLLGDTSRGGRLAFTTGRFANPNDLAQTLLLGIPFLWFVATNPTLSRLRRFAAYAAMAPIVLVIVQTGSRAVMLASAALALILFLRSSITHKVQVLAGACAALVLATAILPDTMKRRYLTFLDVEEPYALTTVELDAYSSAQARWFLLRESVILTFQNPLFGVGPGQFQIAQDIRARAVYGRQGVWHDTHNTFTEISSETGLPGLIFFLAIVVFTFRAVRLPPVRGVKLTPHMAEIAAASLSLRLALVAFVVSGMFASVAYQTQFLVLAGLAVVFSRTGGAEFARWAAAETAQWQAARGFVAAAPRTVSPVAARQASYASRVRP